MRKKQFTIGEIVQFGLLKLEVKEHEDSCCDECYFKFLCFELYNSALKKLGESIGDCGVSTNGKSIMFVELKEEDDGKE